MHLYSPEHSHGERPDDPAEIKQKIKDLLFGITQSGGEFYLHITQNNGEQERALIEVDPTKSLFFARDKTNSGHSAGDVTNLVRALTGGTGHASHKVDYEGPPVDPAVKERLIGLDLEYQAAYGYTDELAVFLATNSIQTEPEGEFEPRKFLWKLRREFTKEKMDHFWTKLAEQMGTINDIVIELENSNTTQSGQELIVETLDPQRAALLSAEQRFNLKRKIIELVKKRKKMAEILKETGDPKVIAAKLTYNSASSLHGPIEIKQQSFFIEGYAIDEDDYKMLASQGHAGKDDEPTTVDSGGFKGNWQGIPFTFIKGSYGGQEISQEQRRKIEEHEKRHAKNEFVMIDESNYAIKKAKDEIIAYIKEGQTLENTKKYLTEWRTPEGRPGLYTYNLEGAAWDRHVAYVTHLIESLTTIKKANLEALAMTPLQLWPRLLVEMDRFTANRPDEDIVEIMVGENLQREVTERRLAEKLRLGQCTLVQAEQEYNALPPGDDTIPFDLQYQLIADYLYTDKNFHLINLNRPNEELLREIDLVNSYADLQTAFASIGEGEPDLALDTNAQYLIKLFQPLLTSKREDIRLLGYDLAYGTGKNVFASVGSERTELDTLEKKIDFARKVLQEGPEGNKTE